MSVLWLDLETFNEAPITWGSHRYAETAEIMLAAYAWDDDHPEVIDLTEGDYLGHLDALQDKIDAAEWVMIHNSGFDRTVLNKQGIRLTAKQVIDTMVVSMQHGFPGKLEQLCEALGLEESKAKSKEGRALIQLFCKPRPANQKLRRATRLTHPVEWMKFKLYAGQDIVAMRECYRRTPKWNCSASERHLWLLDQRVNDRGIAVDKEHAACAYEAFRKEKARLNMQATMLTHGGVTNLGSNARFVEYLEEAYGVHMPNLQMGTLKAMVKDEGTEAEVRDLLSMRMRAAATSPAKYHVIGNAASKDGRVRGLIQFCGAPRTGRDAGRVFQPQNLPRPTLDQVAVEQGIEALKMGCETLLYDNVAELCISAVRGCLVAEEGKKLVIADLSNIEGRVLAWGAGETWKVQAYADFDAGIGSDLYKVAAGAILGKPPEDVTKLERQNQGKVSELACGYQGAVGAFNSMGKNYGVVLPEDEVVAIVKGWRRAHPNIVSFWYAMDDAARAAIRNPGRTYDVNGKAAFDMKDGYLRMHLPSERFLTYKDARIDTGNTCQTCVGKGTLLIGGFAADSMTKATLVICDDCYGSGRITGTGQIIFEGLNQYTRQWGTLSTYGGKLTENWDQATSRDIFMGGLKRAEEGGVYPVVGRVHDELICETPDDPRWNAPELSRMMARGESWTLGLPLVAAGHEMYRYAKLD